MPPAAQVMETNVNLISSDQKNWTLLVSQSDTSEYLCLATRITKRVTSPSSDLLNTWAEENWSLVTWIEVLDVYSYCSAIGRTTIKVYFVKYVCLFLFANKLVWNCKGTCDEFLVTAGEVYRNWPFRFRPVWYHKVGENKMRIGLGISSVICSALAAIDFIRLQYCCQSTASQTVLHCHLPFAPHPSLLFSSIKPFSIHLMLLQLVPKCRIVCLSAGHTWFKLIWHGYF